jgi:LPXTG-site transpeptidase (sortase) family protein
LPEILVNSDLPDPSEAGLPYTVIVQVNPEQDSAVPTGTVLVSDGEGSTCDINLVAGMGSCSLISNLVGTLTLTVVYSGDTNYSPNRVSAEHTVTQPRGPVVVAGENTNPANGSTISQSINQLKVAFNKDVLHDGSPNAANNIANYILVEANGDDFQTTGCSTGQNINLLSVDLGDTTIPISDVTYSNNDGNGPYIATISIPTLSAGTYRLIICGTTSIQDFLGNDLNDGLTDTIIDFSITSRLPSALPKTGFAPNVTQKLESQPIEKQYQNLQDLKLSIPSLGMEAPIIGVPVSKDGWDVTWLGDSTGWLTGSAYPTWEGNSVITGHVWSATNSEGPFAHLKSLSYGDEIRINAWGQVYVYEVRDNLLISANDLSAVMKHKSDHSWITLLTCENYSSEKENYTMRRIVRAVLIETK